MGEHGTGVECELGGVGGANEGQLGRSTCCTDLMASAVDCASRFDSWKAVQMGRS